MIRHVTFGYVDGPDELLSLFDWPFVTAMTAPWPWLALCCAALSYSQNCYTLQLSPLIRK